MQRLTPKERAELWKRHQAGESLSDIARALKRPHATVRYVVVGCGGIAPATRSRGARALTLEDREEISRGLSAGLSFRRIAAALGRPTSTVSREVARNGGRSSYRATRADARAWDKARRPKLCKLAQNRRLRNLVSRKLEQMWSPQQISGWLAKKFVDDPRLRVSHETIYRTLFVQARGVFRKELASYLRSKQTFRKSQKASSKGDLRGQIVDAVSISERPADVEDRAVPGHWEGDLLAGSNNTYIATLVERFSRFLLLVKVDGKDSASVTRALAKQTQKLPQELRLSLTWDRGKEMARHKEFTVATDVKVYFCDPKSPWQRGSNENTNGLLRQYFPKGKPVDHFSQAELNKIARQMNGRPRKTLDFQTPAEALSEALR